MIYNIQNNRKSIPILLLIIFIPYGWAAFFVGSVYRVLTLAMAAAMIFVYKGKFNVSYADKRTLLYFYIYAAYVCITVLWATNASNGAKSAMGLSLICIIASMFAVVEKSKQLNSLILYAWVIMGLIGAVLYAFGGKTQVGEYGSRTSLLIMGTPTDPNEYGGLFIISISCALIALLNSNRKIKRVLLLVLMCFEFYVVMMTGSRGALIAVIVSVVITIKINSTLSVKRVLGVIGSGCILFVVFYNLILPNIPIDIIQRLSIETLLLDQGSGRSSIWSTALKQFWEGSAFNILVGYGSGGLTAGTSNITSTMHNQFVQNLVDFGVIGFVLYIALLARVYFQIKKNMTEYFGIFCGIILMSLTITMGPSYKPFWIFIMMAFFTNKWSEK